MALSDRTAVQKCSAAILSELLNAVVGCHGSTENARGRNAAWWARVTSDRNATCA